MAVYSVIASDIISFSDNPDIINVLRDNIIFSDVSSVSVRQVVNVYDNIRLTTRPKTVYSVSTSDDLVLSDSSKNVISVTASDNIRILDASYRLATFRVTINDEIAFNESISDRYDFTDSVSDDISLSDYPSTIISIPAPEDILTLTDEPTWFVKHLTNDTLVLSDQSSSNVIHRTNLYDSIIFDEQPSKVHGVYLSDSIVFNDSAIDDRIRLFASDEVVFNDYSQVFDRTIMECYDTFVLSDYIEGNISPYIKWLSDSFILEDSTNLITSYRSIIPSNIAFSDNVDYRLIVFTEHSDNISFNDQSYSGVYYGTGLLCEGNNIIINDNCIAKVSRKTEINFTNSMVAAIGTSDVMVYTPPTGYDSTILNISICNVHTSNIEVDIILSKGGSTNINIIKDLPIAVGESYVINNINDGSIQIEEGDEIVVRSSVSNSVDIFLSVIEKQ